MRIAVCAVVLALQPGCSTQPATIAFDHFNPVVLSEHAVARAQGGDIESAWILLERAARIAPHDARILHNLEMVRAFREGRAPRVASVRPAREVTQEPASERHDELPEPPPIWRK